MLYSVTEHLVIHFREVLIKALVHLFRSWILSCQLLELSRSIFQRILGDTFWRRPWGIDMKFGSINPEDIPSTSVLPENKKPNPEEAVHEVEHENPEKPPNPEKKPMIDEDETPENEQLKLRKLLKKIHQTSIVPRRIQIHFSKS